ncbi:MAG TPA: hypothetical protein PLX71_00485 [Phycicoccus sp.]|nr:hypothetical protein [Phycicoccus sp.]
MRTPDRGWLRAARTLVAVGLTVALAAVGHAAGGAHVASAAVLVLLVLLTPLALLATAIRWTFGRAVVGLGVGQVAVHTLLYFMAPGAAATVNGYAATGHPGHATLMAGHGLPPGALETATPTPMTMSWTSSWTPTMIGAHLAATLASALLVAYGERALWTILAILLPAVPGRPWRPDPATAPAPGAPRRLHGIRLLRPRGRAPPPAAQPA